MWIHYYLFCWNELVSCFRELHAENCNVKILRTSAKFYGTTEGEVRERTSSKIFTSCPQFVRYGSAEAKKKKKVYLYTNWSSVHITIAYTCGLFLWTFFVVKERMLLFFPHFHYSFLISYLSHSVSFVSVILNCK